MEKFAVKLRTFLEGLFLWLGSVCFWIIASAFLQDRIVHSFGRRGGRLFCFLLTVLTAAAALWILKARRQETGERISTPAFVMLNAAAFLIAAGAVYLFLMSYAYT